MNDATSPTRQMTALRSQLTEMRPQFAAALPAQIPADRFMRTMATAVQLNPDLLECDRKSLLLAGLRAANDGLLPDGREGAFVIFRDNKAKVKRAQWMPMYQGLLKKVRNSGQLATITAEVVYERDSFDYQLGDEPRISHKPALGERGKPVAVYAIVRTKDGGVYREVMTVDQIERIRQVSRSGENEAGPWTQFWPEMARKTVIRRLYKFLPSSTDLDSYLGTRTTIEHELAPTPADRAAQAPLPDDDSLERAAFTIGCEARAALDGAETPEQVTHIWKVACAELGKLDKDPPLELEAAYHDRLEAVKQRQDTAA